MKKLVSIIVFYMIFCLPVTADVLKTQTMQAFSSVEPPKNLSLRALSDATLPEGIVIVKGALLQGDVINVVQPRSWGRNATFSLRLTKYTDASGKEISPKKDCTIEYRQKMKPNWERQSFSLMGSNDGGKTETGIELSPYDFKLMKDSKNVADFLWKDMNKESMWANGWDLKYKIGETMYFNY